MGLVVAITVGLVAWVTLWAIGAKAFDAFLLTGAIVVLAAAAAALPGTDPISMLLEMVPLLALFELSILIARAFGRPGEAGGMARPSTQEQ